MGIKYGFLDNATYGVDDVNSIVSRLIGAGVSPILASDSYTPEELNALTAYVTSSGVSLNGLKVEIEAGVIKISPGICYFENGATLEVDSEGFEINYDVGRKYYVYAAENLIEASAGIYATIEEPVIDDNNFIVSLAVINADNRITDTRYYARSKIATFGTNATEERQFKKLDTNEKIFFASENKNIISHIGNSEESLISMGYASKNIYEAYITTKTTRINWGDYNYIIIVYTGADGNVDVDKEALVYDISKDYFLFVAVNNELKYPVSYHTNRVHLAPNLGFWVKFIDGELVTIFTDTYNGYTNRVDSTGNYPCSYKLIFV